MIGKGGYGFRRARARFLAATLVGIALLTGSAQAKPSHTRPLITGITFVGGDGPASFEHARGTGARLVRVLIRWPTVAPHGMPADWRPSDPSDPNYDWSEVDLAVTRAIEAGLVPVATIHDAPRWAQRCEAPDDLRGVNLKGKLCNPDPAALAAFAEAAARRYSGFFGALPRVHLWQGLNEPNLSLYFNPQWHRGRAVSPVLYRRLIDAFYFAVKSVRRSNLVLAAGLGPIAVPPLTMGPMRFARQLLCMAGRRNPRPARGNCHGRVHFDIFDIHPYTTGGPNHPGGVDDVELGSLERLTELIRAADRAGRIRGRFRHTPIWDTEFSWDSNPPDPGGVPMRILTRWTAEASHRHWKAGISRLFWLSLRDNAPHPRLPFSETYESGLYFRGATVAEDRPKRNMYAFRFPFVAYSRNDGFYFWGRTPTSEGGGVVIQVRRGATWLRAGAARADRHGIFVGRLRGSYGRRKRGWVRAVYRRERSVPFSLKPVRDFYQPPFGRPVRE